MKQYLTILLKTGQLNFKDDDDLSPEINPKYGWQSAFTVDTLKYKTKENPCTDIKKRKKLFEELGSSEDIICRALYKL